MAPARAGPGKSPFYDFQFDWSRSPSKIDNTVGPTLFQTGSGEIVSPGQEWFGGADRDRTDDLRLAKPPLSQLSYSPVSLVSSVVGLDRFELSTPRLSSVCSNQLSYRPNPGQKRPKTFKEPGSSPGLSKPDRKSTKLPKTAFTV